MKILFVSAVLPYPLYSGGQIRIYNLLKALSKVHQISLFSFIREDKERELLDNLFFCQKVETVLRGHAWQLKYLTSAAIGKYPLLLSTYNNREMRKKLEQELKVGSYDLIHLEPGYVWPALPQTELPLVVSEHNIESQIYEDYVKRFPVPPLRHFLYTDVLKLKYWENQIWKHADGVVTVSETDAAVITSRLNGQYKAIVPNGVDPKVFAFKPKDKLGHQPTFLFVGNFSWLQNSDALGYLLKNLWPEIKIKYPQAKLNVVGRQISDSLRKLSATDGVTILEQVSDISAEYRKADIMLAPIRIGGGTKFKILEAMAVGLPVITTAKGSEGLKITNGQEVITADNPGETLQSIKSLIENTVYRITLITKARKKIEKEYTWENISKKLDKFWQIIHEKNN